MEKNRKLTVLIFAILLFAVIAFASISSFADGAQYISVNNTVEDSGTERDSILYQFDLTQSGKLSINFKHDNLFDTKTYWTIELLADDLETVLQTTESTGVDADLTAYSLGLSKGTYYIRVWARKECSDSYSSNSYQLTPQFKAASNWEVEYNATKKITNDDQSGAKGMSLNKKTYGTIGSGSDVDYYKIKVKKKGYVTLNISHKNVLDADECWVASLINAKTEAITTVSSLGTDKSKTSAKIGLTPGTYYIKVSGGSYSRYNTATYSIKLNFKASTTWEQEYNNSKAKFNDELVNANSLKLGKAKNGTIDNYADIDCFKFKVKKTKKVKLRFSHKYQASTDTYWIVRVYNSKLNEINEYKVAGVNKAYTRTMRLRKGTYFVQVSGSNSSYSSSNYSTTPYKLTVK